MKNRIRTGKGGDEKLEKVLIVDLDKCTGCRICELVCSMVKEKEFNPRKSLIKVLRNKEVDANFVVLSNKCDYCGDCIEWCTPEALSFVNMEEAILSWKGAKLGRVPAPLFGI